MLLVGLLAPFAGLVIGLILYFVGMYMIFEAHFLESIGIIVVVIAMAKGWQVLLVKIVLTLFPYSY